MTDNPELQELRAKAIADDRCFSLGRLREEFRMKPAPGVQPVKMYKNPHGGKYGIYRIAECVPLRASSTSRSEKQIQAAKKLGRLSQLNSDRGKAAARAFRLLERSERLVVLDTESTGLGIHAQVIEIGVTDSKGNVLLDVRLLPTVPIEEGAAAVHGISLEILAGAVQWPDIASRLQNLLTGSNVVIFNEEFDVRILKETARAHGDPAHWLNELETTCAMKLAAEFCGSTNRWGTISLANAVERTGVSWAGKAHSAAGDAATTANVVTAIAAYYLELQLDE